MTRHVRRVQLESSPYTRKCSRRHSWVSRDSSTYSTYAQKPKILIYQYVKEIKEKRPLCKSLIHIVNTYVLPYKSLILMGLYIFALRRWACPPSFPNE
uniref:Uncharacterized protein n=1 Tax=uncultured Thiotrichaceae bacterium TaxID=298394 RepID=A0A6S6UG84_9GAMM|nr:MAG: Unknown protein [uncultured Thiotrichaceae bacterium]